MLQPMSQINKKQTAWIIAMLIGGLIATTGCTALRDKLPGSGNGLAFWKKDSEDQLPPPPARHFDPASSESYAGNGSQPKDAQNVDAIRRDIDAKLDRAAGLTSSDGSATRSDGSATRSDGSASKTPLRQPYQEQAIAEGSAGSGSVSDGSKDFSGSASKTDPSSSTVTNGFNPQQNLRNALAGAQSTASNIASKAQNATEVTYDSAGNLVTAGANKLKDFGSQTKNKLDSSLAAVNPKLHDAQGRLTSGIKNATENPLQSARERFNQAISNTGAAAQQTTEGSKNFLGSLKDKISAATQPASKNFAGTSTELNTGFDYPGDAPGLLQPFQPKAQSTAAPAQVATKPLVPMPKPEANRFVTALPQPKPQPASKSFGGSQTRVANVTPVKPAASNAGSSNKSFGPGLPANNYASASGSASSNNASQVNVPLSPLRHSVPSPSTIASAPSTPSTVAPISSSFGQGGLSAVSHQSEVDLPSKILSGSGSYAPGSVKIR